VTVWTPWTSEGTWNAQEKDPEALVVVVQTVMDPGDHVTVIAELAANPLPVEVTLEPTVPLLEERSTLGVTVKEVLVKFEGIELSAAVTVWLPWTAGGTTKEHENEPPEEVVAVQSETALGDQVTETEAVAAKEEPETVTLVPTGPLEVESEMLQPLLQEAATRGPAAVAAEPEEITQKFDWAKLAAEERSVAEITCSPLEATGTVPRQAKSPSASVEGTPAWQGSTVPSQVIWTGAIAAKPDPEMLNEAPVAPLSGARTSEGDTVRVVVTGEAPLPSAERSLTVRVWTPATAAGTKTRQENPPSAVTPSHSGRTFESQETETRAFSQRPDPESTT
jgi:hypothetical protein